MHDARKIIDAIRIPMEEYNQSMVHTVGDWEPLIGISERLLAGYQVEDSEFPPVLQPIVELMKVVMAYTENAEWDWSSPAIQEVFRQLTDSYFYRILAESTAKMVLAIAVEVEIGTVVEVGTGPGQVTDMLCEEMVKYGVSVPIIISDRSPTIAQTGEKLRKTFSELTISDYVWDVAEEPPSEMLSKLVKPVLVFERFCIPYGGYEAIDKIGPIADIFVMTEDLNLLGKKEPYDVIMEKIGARFLTFKEAKEHLDKHFSVVHTCDQKTIDAVNLPVSDFTLAIR